MSTNLRKVLIVGAGTAGRELLKELSKKLNNVFEVVGFIDDDPRKQKSSISGMPVLGTSNDLDRVLKETRTKEVFIALPSAAGHAIKKVIDSCQKRKVTFKIVPRVLEVVLGKVKLPQVREVRIEDLLGRPMVDTDQQKFLDFFSAKKVLVTGAAGSIGSELCRQLIQFNPEKLICLDAWENGLFELESQLRSIGMQNYMDPGSMTGTSFEIVVANIQDVQKIKAVFKKYQPDYVFHAAAYKHVPIMQSSPDEAVKNNVFGTSNLALTALNYKVEKFINISTDKAADPSSVMGVTKYLAEKIVKCKNKEGITKFSSVRFGNVLDSNGSVVPTFRKQIANGGPITITDPRMTRFFMTIPEAVQLVLEASIIGEGGEIFVLDMGQPVKIEEMARLMIRLSGFLPGKEIKIKYVGMRPGEKLAEILHTPKESLEKTANKKIFKIKQRNGNGKNLEDTISELKKLVYSQSPQDLIHFLRKVAPNLQN